MAFSLTASRKKWREREVRLRVRYLNAKKWRRKRDKQIAEARNNPRHKALVWARQQVGTVEHPPGSNSGPKIDDWNRASIGITGIPWCQSFANAVLVAGSGPQLKSAYTPQVVQWAREVRFGLKIVPRFDDRRVGDMVFFKWPGVSKDFCDHVGVYAGNGKTVEGNTSAGTAGSQNNGGGVFVRERGLSNVVAVVRPTY